MKSKIMIDTNILVYAYDPSDIQKEKAAINVLNELVDISAGIISAQVLSEFFVTITRKIPYPLTVDQAAERIKVFSQIWPVVEINEFIVGEAVRGVLEHQLSYWDALIWAAARLNQAFLILSEDFSHNSTIGGVRFFNPFKDKLPWQEA